MNLIWQLSNDINSINEHRQKKKKCGSETLAFEIIKAVPLFPFSLIKQKREGGCG